MIGHSPWTPQTPDDPALTALLDDARVAAGDPVAALALADRAAAVLPLPGSGRTAQLWRGLAELAAVDLTVARALEPHLDAVAILAQATEAGYAVPQPAGTWGVYAAEGPGARLEARDTGEGRLLLTGRKPWCSLAEHVGSALVTAWLDDALAAVDLSGVELLDEPWVARGLPAVRSTGLQLTEVPAVPVGAPGWYLSRPGFAWGGLGVAACWLGGAMGLARRMRRGALERQPDPIGLSLLGQVDTQLTAAAAVLTEAATAVDAGLVQGEHAWARSVRVRHVVHDACEAVLALAAHALGPGPLAGEEEHAARVADLQLYLRQHKAERDAAVVGRAVVDGMPVTWS
ncbi:acyl-CoA dehydrogenase [Georgenia satyanarayanai]|uniref:acyl-CoA dehydrogenase n=1 Tax=Georgenia satyanarayanai TaxID=860221 RepID=UPI00203B5E1B|nr:acyl-CoA dehydrogenase [Georgenia satyanarayanai]MCM3659433.1 acyl-CoA dehydrogenase [Georgenia satyanarayanai]